MEVELTQLAAQHGFRLAPPAKPELIDPAKMALRLPQILCDIYAVSNGLQHEWFRIPPLHDPNRTKQTWDSIQRQNDPEHSKFLSGASDFLTEFLLLAELGGSDFAVFKRDDRSIWFSQGQALHKTNLDLLDFIRTTLREVDEL